MPIDGAAVADALAAHLERHPEEAAALAEPLGLIAAGGGVTSRRSFPMHVTVGALLVRAGAEILLIQHRAYGITLQPGGHLEAADRSLADAALRELREETGIDPARVQGVSPDPAYIEYGQVPARPEKDEPEHHHLDIGYCFTTAGDTQIGCLQETEVSGGGWYPLAAAEHLVGTRIARAVTINDSGASMGRS